MPGIAATGTIKPIAAIANTTRIADMATIATMPGTMPAGVAGMRMRAPAAAHRRLAHRVRRAGERG